MARHTLKTDAQLVQTIDEISFEDLALVGGGADDGGDVPPPPPPPPTGGGMHEPPAQT